MNANTFYEIRHGQTTTLQVGGKYSFETPEEAIKAVKEFKENPKLDNKNMSDQNADYWKNQNYTIIKRTVSIEEIVTI